MSIDKLLVSKSELIINSLPYDTSEHSKYICAHSEEIIKKINLSMQEERRKYIINQFKSHQEAKKVYLD